ncbi:DUF192 domain-containing protein [Spiribacter sp. C176]|uniref:DUF192 domain-containing protein n=1 Tax=Spiribacter salilacus TaxID=2664894 RepID=A0A6N7QSS7_9GAMM|nr:DUF192 domain-containing protein [Spiribacter salilacus]MRH77367.1 DUF192 domain-containing protein [Spiribacter salilacus]
MTPPFKVGLKVENADGIYFEVTLATRKHERGRGLLGSKPLSGQKGLLLWPGGSVHTFGMTYPIDVLFLNHELRVLHCQRFLRPWRIALAPWKTQGTLELAADESQLIDIGHRFYPFYGDFNQ